jgi:hypothetical protein
VVIRSLISVAAVAVAAIFLLSSDNSTQANAAVGGPVFISSGHYDTNCSPVNEEVVNSDRCMEFFPRMMSSIFENSNNNGSKILIFAPLGKETESTATDWNSAAGGPNAVVTYVTSPERIRYLLSSRGAVELAEHAMIFIHNADFDNVNRSLVLAQTQVIERHSSTIVDFVNNGGGLMAFSQAKAPNRYSWVPTHLVTTETLIDSRGSVQVLPELEEMVPGIEPFDVEFCCARLSFDDPDPDSGLSVLMYRDFFDDGIRQSYDQVSAVGGLNVVLTKRPYIGGPVFISNTQATWTYDGPCDADCDNLHRQVLTSILNNSTAGPAENYKKQVLWIRRCCDNGTSIRWIREARYGAFYTPMQAISDAEDVLSVNFFDYNAVIIDGYQGADPNGFQGIAEDVLLALNTRGDDLIEFVNSGGGLMAFNEHWVTPESWAWLPERLEMATHGPHTSGNAILPTNELLAMAPAVTSDYFRNQRFNTSFIMPTNVNGLEILAFHDHKDKDTDLRNGVYDPGEHVRAIGGLNVVMESTAPITGGPVYLSSTMASSVGECPSTACHDLHKEILTSMLNESEEPPHRRLLWIKQPGSYTTDAPWVIDAVGDSNSGLIDMTSPEEIRSVNFRTYEVILIDGYTDGDPEGSGLSTEVLRALNDRQDDLAHFVNTGGGLMAFYEDSEDPESWGWLPTPPVLEDVGVHSGDSTLPTLELVSMSSGVTSDDFLNQSTSYGFQFPEEGTGMQVLSYHDHGQNDQYDPGEHIRAIGGHNVVLSHSGAPAPDTEPPVVSVPVDMTILATSFGGAVATFSASATDNVGVASGPTCDPASGSLFPIGTTSVTCTAIDAAGNSDDASFTVTVLGGRSLIAAAADGLSAVSGDDKEFAHILKHLDKALSDDHWADNLHPDSKHGKKVFDEARGAIKDLEKLLREDNNHDPITDDEKDAIELAIERLVVACQILAANAIADAEAGTTTDPKRESKVDKEIAKANKHFDDAMSSTDPDDAVNDLKKAWEHALHALKHQEK